MTYNPSKDYEQSTTRIEAGWDLVKDYTPLTFTWAVLPALASITRVKKGTVVGQITSNTVVTNAGNLTADSFVYQSANTVRITFSGTPNLSTLVTLLTTSPVILAVSGASDEFLNGTFNVLGADNTGNYIDVENLHIIDDSHDIASGAGITGVNNYPNSEATPYTIGKVAEYDDTATDGRETAIGILSGVEGGGDTNGDILISDQKYTNPATGTEGKNEPVVRVYTSGKGGFYESRLIGLDANAKTDLDGTTDSEGVFKF
jgi:hypothetical protein